MSYLIAYLQSRTEKLFKEDLEERGIDVWYPTIKKITKPRHKRKLVESIKPVFGNYVFIRIEENTWDEIHSHKNVIYLLKMGVDVISVSDNIIEDMKYVVWKEDEELRFSVGDIVTVRTGLFEGYIGSVLQNSVEFVWIVLIGHKDSSVKPNKHVVKVGVYFLDKVRHSDIRTTIKRSCRASSEVSRPLGPQGTGSTVSPALGTYASDTK